MAGIETCWLSRTSSKSSEHRDRFILKRSDCFKEVQSTQAGNKILKSYSESIPNSNAGAQAPCGRMVSCKQQARKHLKRSVGKQ